MDPLALTLLAVGLALGAVAGYLARGGLARLADERAARIADLEARLAARETEAGQARAAASLAERRAAEAEARREAERAAAEEKLALLEDARSRAHPTPSRPSPRRPSGATTASFLALARTQPGEVPGGRARRP